MVLRDIRVRCARFLASNLAEYAEKPVEQSGDFSNGVLVDVVPLIKLILVYLKAPGVHLSRHRGIGIAKAFRVDEADVQLRLWAPA